MSRITVELDDDLVALLQQSPQPVERTARDLIVLELYRQGTISRGKAAQVLGVSLLEFIRAASQAGIPYFDMTDEEWDAERARSEAL